MSWKTTALIDCALSDGTIRIIVVFRSSKNKDQVDLMRKIQREICDVFERNNYTRL